MWVWKSPKHQRVDENDVIKNSIHNSIIQMSSFRIKKYELISILCEHIVTKGCPKKVSVDSFFTF